MISVVIYGIIAIALAAAAGYAVLSSTTLSLQTTDINENDVRMEAAVNAIRASMAALAPGATGGTLFPPMGSSATYQATAYTSLPSTLSAVGATPWGQPYGYCPVSQVTTFAPTPTASGRVTSPDGTNGSYAVTTYQNTLNQVYVALSSPPNNLSGAAAAGYVGFITSSKGPGQATPGCDQINLPGSLKNPTGITPTATGGIVRGITAGFVYNQRVIASVDRLDLYVASQTAGDGTGRDVNNPTTMATAITLWQTLQPRQTDIHLTAAGTYSINSNLDTLNDDTAAADATLNIGQPYADGENTSLVIGADVANVIVQLGNEVILNSATTFNNLKLTTNYTITAFKPLTLDNVNLTATGGSGAPSLNTFDTTFLSYDSNFASMPMNFNVSNVEFYDHSPNGSSFTDSPLSFSLSQAQFYGLNASISTISYTMTNTVSNTPLVTMDNSQLSIPPGIKITGKYSFASTSNPFLLMNSRLQVGGTLALTGNGAGIMEHDGSTVSILGSVTVNGVGGGALGSAVYVEGSKLTLEGSLSVSSAVTQGTAILLQHGDLTGYHGGAAIHVDNPKTVSCVQLNQGLSGLPPETGPWQSPVVNNPSLAVGTTPKYYPLYIDPRNATSSPVDSVSFAQAQYGMPPLTGWQNSNPSTDGTDTNNGTILDKAYPEHVVVLTDAVTGKTYVPAANLEQAVRNLVNAEFLSGSSLYFLGGCTSP